MKLIKTLLSLVALGLLSAALFIYVGAFNVAADAPHSRPVLKLLEQARERSIAVRAKDIKVPPLDDPEMITSGGADYNEMCTGCHLKPGMANSELRTAMYPQPPDLTKVTRNDPAETFWVIKHGIKMSAMPAWGATHDDQRMWAMVAFLQQLPRLTPAQYQILTARGDDDSGDHDHGEMAGMDMSDPHADAGGVTSASSDLAAHSGHQHADQDAATAAAAVDSFLHALASGNQPDAQKWLAPDVLIYESGHVESSRKEYAEQHMQGDIEFLSKAKTERLARSGDGDANLAWVASRSRIRGQNAGKPFDLLSTETMILKRTADGWRIQHIHWSSADAKAR